MVRKRRQAGTQYKHKRWRERDRPTNLSEPLKSLESRFPALSARASRIKLRIQVAMPILVRSAARTLIFCFSRARFAVCFQPGHR